MPRHKSQSFRKLQRQASRKDEVITPKAEKMRKLPPSLNKINKNITDDW